MVEESLEWSLIKMGIEFGIGGVGDGRGPRWVRECENSKMK